jgi:multicomponent Na+:H+ antiporter subunit D
MTSLIPLCVGIPLLLAAILLVFSRLIPRALADSIAIAGVASIAAISLLLLNHSLHGTAVYWFGKWHPIRGFAVGICFVVDPLSAGLATLVALLMLAAMIFSWRYLESVGTIYQCLMLIFLGSMIAFALAGDLFDMFVFFELMSAVAYALTGYKVEEESALEGAINFGVTNSVGAFFVLAGIGLLYGRTSALNLAQIGRALANHNPDGLVLCALTFIVAGFLVKAAMVPFHFWLSDAHAVAPTPVCVLFSGVMVELGLYAAVRVYWTVFSGVPHIADCLRPVLLGFGVTTALLGAVMCLLQRHLKRLLAFSTISHMGVFVIGAAALSPIGLAGTAVYVIGHGLVKSALFICSGIILSRAGTVDELELLPSRVGSPLLILIYAAAGLGLAGLPPFATALGKDLLEKTFHGWLQHVVWSVMFISSSLTGAAVLRAGGRIFFGWGTQAGEEQASPTELKSTPELRGLRGWIPGVMSFPAAGLVALAILSGLAPRLHNYAYAASAQVENRIAYASMVLDGRAEPGIGPAKLAETSWKSGFISAGCAIAIALFELFGRPIPKFCSTCFDPAVRLLHVMHSGQIGDYITWVVVGISSFAAGLIAIRFLAT